MSESSPLPSPADLPGSDVVVFDGNCQFCTRQVQRLHQLDARRLSFLSLHDPQVRELCPNLTHEQLMAEMFVVEPSGRQHGGAAAFRYLTRKLPWLWPLAPIMHLPFSLPLWAWLYGHIAKRRYWFNRKAVCDSDSCQIHYR